ncbi:IclR family transcriptional regulator [Noviherbaspirillum aerium]|uniref:IclR family transcriptional regulator n=1 Tax=Noviherbaspirillum aerium TaxID=2588497 RepID=UPI00178C55BC|nr:helix-turn-helix domain-containing protein [Noviherbaspirillum aerium]
MAATKTSPHPANAPADALDMSRMDDVGVAAVNRALAILDSFTEDAAVLTLAQISMKTGLYKSTILRLMQSLDAFGYVNKLDSGAYVLGPRPMQLAALAAKALHPAEVVMPALRELVQAAGESASFYVRSGPLRLCSYRVDSPRSIRDNVQVGQLLPLDKGAAGHVLVDFEHQVPANAGGGPRADMLVRISRGERDPETAAIACPVFGAGNRLQGALTLSGPLTRFSEAQTRAMVAPLIAAARKLTIGFMGDAGIFAHAS